LISSEQGVVAGLCEGDNEPSGYTEAQHFKVEPAPNRCWTSLPSAAEAGSSQLNKM
jgi:hypothetical protein